jgi:hypothetical protein
MTYTTSLRLTRWISTLVLTATVPLVGCGNSDLPPGTSSSSDTSSSSGTSPPSCPKDTSAASQLVAIPGVKAVAATSDSLYIMAPNPMDFGDQYLSKTPAAGGAIETITFTGSASTLLTDGDELYYVAGRTLVLGSAPTYIGEDGVDFVEMALDKTSYYVLARDMNNDTSYVVQGPRSGGAPTKKIALPDGTARTLAVDEAAVYVVIKSQDTSAIMRAPIDGSAVTTVVTDVIPNGIAVDATSLYYFRVAADTVTTELVRSDKTSGGVDKVLLPGMRGARGLLLAGDLYTVEMGAGAGEGKIQRISTQGDCGQVLATGQQLDPYPYTYSLLAANATDVYWATADGVGHVTR